MSNIIKIWWVRTWVIMVMILPFSSLQAQPYNAHLLYSLKQMPEGGGYSVKKEAFSALDVAIEHQREVLSLRPDAARPSFCSGATYLVFLHTVQHLQQTGEIKLSEKELSSLDFHDEKDGEGIWGRWNANGPGVAKLFKDLKCGVNFEEIGQAQAGDFMKIFWTEEIGAREFGHLVIYLRHDEKSVTFWSSNQPGGYGVKSVPRSDVKWAIFSRLTAPKRLSKVDGLSRTDPFLIDMLQKSFTREEVRKKCGMVTP